MFRTYNNSTYPIYFKTDYLGGGAKTGEGTDEKQVTYFFGLNNNRNIASLSKSYQICIINEHSLFIYIQYGHVGVIFKQKSGSI